MSKNNAGQFNELATLYEDTAHWPFRKEIEIPSVLQAIGDVEGLSVLDFGCGTGMYSRWLKQRGAGRVVGYDPTKGMLNYARRRAEKESPGISFVTRLSPDLIGQFDLVLAVHVLQYASSGPELQDMCADMVGLLRPDGRLLTLPIHPSYDPRRSYYERYGLRLSADDLQKPYVDGGGVRIRLCKNGKQGSVFAAYWSAASLERALGQAGLRSLKWRELDAPECAALGQAPKELHAYLQKPHSIIIEGVRARDPQ
ncbi:class I SAM-dependent methyltransferase [Bradyrhizobium retamae]|uniref:Methyltransferase type 12 n=1 Tax=Bradyrhizobium retamae TaxID=1300035 RepID=A0A0R3NCK7_9BRAD|nr:class I SAM-dependent methyltransferase [Bradyrhizobium retamae]KRR29857.1 methyltransferase type 12 [Bradyrhizobium retamae]